MLCSTVQAHETREVGKVENHGHAAKASNCDNTSRSRALVNIGSLFSPSPKYPVLPSRAKSSMLFRFCKSDVVTVRTTDNKTLIMEKPRRYGKPRVSQSHYENRDDLEDSAAMASATRLFKEFKSRNGPQSQAH